MTRAIEELHSCHVEWTARTAGKAQSGTMSIRMIAQFDLLPGSSLPKTVKVESTWPHRSARTLEGMVYNLLWQLDYAIQQAYEQMILPAE